MSSSLRRVAVSASAIALAAVLFVVGAVSASAAPRPPAAPTGVKAVAGNASATVSWTAPHEDGDITGYTVTSNPGAKTCSTAGHSRSCTVSGLTNGTRYTFTVKAKTKFSTSAASSPSAAVTPTAPAEVAGAPTAVTASPGDTSADLSWVTPASDGGAAVTGYSVTSSPAGRTCTATTTSCTVSGLTNGTAYTFTVVAINSAGAGPASTPSDAVIPRTVPGAPTLVAITSGNMRAALSWTAPADDGGSAVRGYTAECTPDDTTLPVRIVRVSKPFSGTTVAGLMAGTTYSCTVSAVNFAGQGTASAPMKVVADRLPGIPTAVVLTPGDGSAVATWSAPNPTGASAVTSYSLTCSIVVDGVKVPVRTLDDVSSGVTIEGLENGTTYSCAISGTNAVGTGAHAARMVTPSTTPDAPLGVVATPMASRTLLVTWTAPQSNGGAAILGYTVTCTNGVQTRSMRASASALSLTVAGLTNGSTYTCTVTARNAAGTSSAAQPMTAAPQAVAA